MTSKQIWVLIIGLALGTAAYGQGMSEFGATHAMSAGLGAGLAASLSNHTKVLSRSYRSTVKVQQALAAQTKAIQQYMQYGYKLEAQKKWADAERSYKYVLQIIARRDGPGSQKSVPTLEHLVTVTKAQNKLDDAINFQDTVLSFKSAITPANPPAVVRAQQNLVNLLEQNNDYNHAASVLRQSVSYYDSHPNLPRKDKFTTRAAYAKVLRKLHRDEEADAEEAANTEEEKTAAEPSNLNPGIDKKTAPQTAPENKPVAPAPEPNPKKTE